MWLTFWFLRLLSLCRLFTFFNLSKLSSFPSTFATTFAAFALCSRLYLGLCNRLGCWGISRSFAGILGPAVLSCMTWLAAMAAFYRLCMSSFATIVASDALRALLWPCSHRHLVVQVIGEFHTCVVCHHRLPNSGHCCCTTVKLHELCYLVWQVSQVEKVLIPLSDAQVSQLTSNQWSFQHRVKSFDLSPNLSQYIHKKMPLWLLHRVLQAGFSVCSASGRLIKLNSLRSNLKSSKPFASWMP